MTRATQNTIAFWLILASWMILLPAAASAIMGQWTGIILLVVAGSILYTLGSKYPYVS